jgi:hypothetical protein
MSFLKAIRYQIVTALPNFASQKISAFSTWQDGWKFGRGSAFSQQVVSNAQRLNSAAYNLGLKIDAFPGDSGQISVVVYCEGVSYDFAVLESGRVLLVVEEDDEITEELEISFDEALNRITTLGSEPWTGFFTSTSPTTRKTKSDFVPKLLKIPATEVEFPSLQRHVSSVQPGVFAVTAYDSTQQPPLTLQCFGNSIRQQFLQVAG